MSDLGRKNVSDKISEAVKPESEKSTLESAKDSVTSTIDKAAANATPDNQKSFTQTISDNVTKGHDDAKAAAGKHSEGLAETVQPYVDAAKEQIGNAANYVSSVVTGATEGAKTGADSSKK